jgi:hypothetical protein
VGICLRYPRYSYATQIVDKSGGPRTDCNGKREEWGMVVDCVNGKCCEIVGSFRDDCEET